MPRISSFNDDHETVDRYSWPAQYVTPTACIGEALRSWRKTAIKDREEFLGFQQACGKSGDRDGAKFFKECAAHEMKLQRACTCMLPWFVVDADKNQLPQSPKMWPIDLADELDEIARRILLLD
jgi:hypothetical protein